MSEKKKHPSGSQGPEPRPGRWRGIVLGKPGPGGYYGSGWGDDLEEVNPVPRLSDELRAVEHAIARLKEKPQYDEAALAELQVRRRELQAEMNERSRGMESRHE